MVHLANRYFSILLQAATFQANVLALWKPYLKSEFALWIGGRCVLLRFGGRVRDKPLPLAICSVPHLADSCESETYNAD